MFLEEYWSTPNFPKAVPIAVEGNSGIFGVCDLAQAAIQMQRRLSLLSFAKKQTRLDIKSYQTKPQTHKLCTAETSTLTCDWHCCF